MRWQHPLVAAAAVGIGGAVGAVARWGLMLGGADHLGKSASLLLVVNGTGCALLAIVLVLGEHRLGSLSLRHVWRPLMATGVLGGFTSTSAFAGISLALGGLHGFVYAATSVAMGLGAFAACQQLAMRWFAPRAGDLG